MTQDKKYSQSSRAMLLISLSFKQLTLFGVKHYQIQTFYTHTHTLCTHLSLSSSRPSTIAFLSLTIATSFFISSCSFFLSQDVFRCSAHTHTHTFHAQISGRFSFSPCCALCSVSSLNLTWFFHQPPELLLNSGLLFLQLLGSSTAHV